MEPILKRNYTIFILKNCREFSNLQLHRGTRVHSVLRLKDADDFILFRTP